MQRIKALRKTAEKQKLNLWLFCIRDVEELLHQYKPETLNYALGHRDRCYTNCTNPEDTDSGSRLARAQACLIYWDYAELDKVLQSSVFNSNLSLFRPDSRCSVQSRAEDEIEAARGKLNVTEIDQVVDRLRWVWAMLRILKALKTFLLSIWINFELGHLYQREYYHLNVQICTTFRLLFVKFLNPSAFLFVGHLKCSHVVVVWSCSRLMFTILRTK